MKKTFLTVIITAILTTLVLGSGVYFWQNKPAHKDTLGSQTNSKSKNVTFESKAGFSLEIPDGYTVNEFDDGLNIIKKPNSDDETSLPEITMGWDAGWNLDLELPTTEATVLAKEPVTINGIKGNKLTITYKWLPKGNQCPRYRLENKGIIYDIGLYECLESDIFEDVVKSFRINKDKN